MEDSTFNKENKRVLKNIETKTKMINKRFYLLKRLLSTLFISLVLGAFSNTILIIFQTRFDWNRVYLQIFEIRPELFWSGSLILAVLYWWISSLIGDRDIGAILFIALSFAIGTITYQKMLLRAEPFYPSDFSMITGFSSLVKMVDVKVVILIVVLVVLLGALIFAILRYKKKKDISFIKKKKWVARIVIFLISSLFLGHVGNFNQPGNSVRDFYDQYAVWTAHSQQTNYLHNGFLSGFLYNLDGPVIDIPENYSKATMEELFNKYQNEADNINLTRNSKLSNVNLIYVMNETFSDPLKIEGITISDDPIPLTRKRMEENISGEVLSQGYGGGTANIEFEALTGISMEPLATNITTPFIQMTWQMDELPSVVDFLTDNSYETTAIHPFNTSMYKRKDVYEKMGFSTFLYEDTMKNTGKVENNRYISDDASYEEVMNRLAETPNTDFVHLVTMQNHAIYSDKYPSPKFTVSGVPEELEARNYFQDLSYSDKALDGFLDEVKNMSEKTMVVFWGDHLPSLYGNDLYSKNGNLVMHQTPFMIYSNFTDTIKNIDTISPIYFMNHVLEETNSFVSPYYALLMSLERKLPAFEKGLYIEQEDTKSEKTTRDKLSKETWEVLKDYELLLYDLTDGSNYTQNSDFFAD